MAFFISVSSTVADVGKSFFFEMIHLSQPLYESIVKDKISKGLRAVNCYRNTLVPSRLPDRARVPGGFSGWLRDCAHAI